MSFRLRYAFVPGLIALVAACGDRDRPTITAPPLFDLTSTQCFAQQARAYELIDLLWVPGTPQKNAKGHFTAMLQKLKEDNLDGARFYMWSVIENGNQRAAARDFQDPNGGAPPTIGGAVAELNAILFVCGGLTPPDPVLVSTALDNGGGAKVIGSSGGDLITLDGDAGIRVPAGAVSENHLFLITPLDHLNDNSTDSDQCLDGSVPEYGLCMDFTVHPNTTFAVQVTAVVCTHPFGPVDEQTHARLQMASEDLNGDGLIEIYDRALDPLALDCVSSANAVRSGVLDWPVFARSGIRDLVRGASGAVEKLRPQPLLAADGLGCLLSAFETRFRPVDPLGSVEGTVSDATTSQGIAGATVRLLDTEGVEIDTRTTDVNGAYRFRNLLAGTYQLEFSATGFTSVTRQTIVRKARTTVESAALSPVVTPNTLLLYGPAGGTSSFQSKAQAAGWSVTVYSASQWSAATTSTFASFDVVAVPTLLGGNDVRTLAATSATWGAAVEGNIVLTGLHADQHFQTGATQYLLNALTFAAAGTKTGFVSLTDCSATPYTWVPQRSPFTGLTAASCFSADQITITDPTHPVMSGLTDAALSNWGQSLHTYFSNVGGFGFIAVANGGGVPSNSPAVLVWPAPVVIE